LFLLALIILVFFIPESLRYLFDNEQYEELDLKLKNIAKTNGRDEQSVQGARPYVLMGDSIKRENKPNSFKMIENDSNNFLNVVCIGVIWISSTFNYYLISRNLEA